MIRSDLAVHYINHMGDDRTVVNSARVSYNKQIQTLADKDRSLLVYLARNKHFSPFEHCVLSVLIECPLYIRSQIHRHRTFSYNEISRRYTSDNITYYLPPLDREQDTINKQSSIVIDSTMTIETMRLIVESAIQTYNRLIDTGVAREVARSVLPQCIMTKFYMTGNLRNWHSFIELRMSHRAQYECQIIAEKIHAILLAYFPKSYEALHEARQIR